MVPFILALLIYMAASSARLSENPNDKLLPSLTTMSETMKRLAFEPSVRTGEYVFWQDTWMSLRRVGLGVGISAIMALAVGILTGSLPLFRAIWLPFLTAFAMIPTMAILPVLFILFGLEELSKVMLIIFGIAPFMMRDIHQRVTELPEEQLIKVQTLGGGTWQAIARVILPQILPRLIDSVRLALGATWIFLISAEAIAADSGLGYRIFLVRRYMAMDVILPYVAWITLIAFVFDYSLRQVNRLGFPWYQEN